MISRYNLQQAALAGLCGLGSLLGYAAAWLFFRYVPVFIAYQFRYPIASSILNVGASAALLLLTCSGCRLWRKQSGFYNYFDSGLYQTVGGSWTGFAVLGDRAGQVSGLAYGLGQLFLAGPLMALRSVRHFRSRIAPEPGLEARLAAVLVELRKLKQWEEVRQHPDQWREILLLAKMGRIDFSAARGEPRFRAFASQ